MIIRSKAPLRLGLAGGGSDVSPYSDLYGGLILNATINLYAYCTIEETDNGRIEIEATDIRQRQVFDSAPQLPIDGVVDLHKGVYNRIMRDYTPGRLSFRITTFSAIRGKSSSVTAAVGFATFFTVKRIYPSS